MKSIWVKWVRRLQSIAQNGRNYSKNEFDLQRYQQVEDVAAEIAARYSDGELKIIKGMFRGEAGPATPKIDVRAAVVSGHKILLVKERGDGWTLPGGWVDPGESPSGYSVHDLSEPMIVAAITIETPETVNTVFGFFAKGGLFMWPLLACSIVSVTIMILRGLALRRNKVMPPLIENEIERLTPGESPERLSRIVHHDGSSLARIARVALQYLRSPRSENVEAVQTRARHEMVRLEKGLIILEVIVGIAPLLGLIGAVSGLVHVFSQLGLSSGASDTRQIALGISEALNATVFGLSIAVPTLIGFTYFSRKVEVMSVEMETLVVELINKCYYGRSSREFASAKAAAASSLPISTPVA